MLGYLDLFCYDKAIFGFCGGLHGFGGEGKIHCTFNIFHTLYTLKTLGPSLFLLNIVLNSLYILYFGVKVRVLKQRELSR